MREDGPRLIGNVAIEVDLDGRPRVLAGFENHGGRTRLGARLSARSAASCAVTATTGSSGLEGVRGGAHGTVIGTYLHGPLLPKNAWFADWLIATALGLRRRRAGAARRRARGRRARRRAPRGRGLNRRSPSIRWGSIRRPLPGSSS